MPLMWSLGLSLPPSPVLGTFVGQVEIHINALCRARQMALVAGSGEVALVGPHYTTRRELNPVGLTARRAAVQFCRKLLRSQEKDSVANCYWTSQSPRCS